MDCHECKEKMLLYLDDLDASCSVGACHGVSLRDFENHIKSCPSCAKEVAELKEALRLVKDKEVFIPEFTENPDLENVGAAYMQPVPKMPQALKNAVRAEYPILPEKEKRGWFSPSFRFAYAMAFILCIGLGIYLVTFLNNNSMLASKTPIQEKTAVTASSQTAPMSPAPTPAKDKELFSGGVETKKEPLAAKPEKTMPTPTTPAPPGAGTPGAEAPPASSKVSEIKEDSLKVKSLTLPSQAAPQLYKKATPQPEASRSEASPPKIQPMALPQTDIETKSGAEKTDIIPAELNEKIKKIVSEYKDVTFAIKKENNIFSVTLTCPKNMKKETIEELKTKIFNQTKIDKNKILVIMK